MLGGELRVESSPGGGHPGRGDGAAGEVCRGWIRSGSSSPTTTRCCARASSPCSAPSRTSRSSARRRTARGRPARGEPGPGRDPARPGDAGHGRRGGPARGCGKRARAREPSSSPPTTPTSASWAPCAPARAATCSRAPRGPRSSTPSAPSTPAARSSARPSPTGCWGACGEDAARAGTLTPRELEVLALLAQGPPERRDRRAACSSASGPSSSTSAPSSPSSTPTTAPRPPGSPSAAGSSRHPKAVEKRQQVEVRASAPGTDHLGRLPHLT